VIFLPDFFAEVRKIEQEMRDLLERVHHGAEAVGSMPYANLVPPVDIMERGNTLEIVLDVPGINGEDLTIQFGGGVLVVTGRKPAPEYVNSASNFVCMERNFGTFRRKIYVQRPVDMTQSRAVLENGILTITLRTQPERRGSLRQIPIKTVSTKATSEEIE